MPGSQTKLDIYNMAIDLVRDNAIQSTTDNSATARWLNRNYDQIVKSLLRTYPWNFAKLLVKLPADTLKPPFGWCYAYKPPPGWQRILPITVGGWRNGDLVPHEIVGDRIYTNEPPPLCVRLIMDKTANPGEWDSLFVTLATGTMALGMANKFTGKAAYISRAQQIVENATAEAEQIDAFEGSPEPIEAFDVLRVRGAPAPGGNSWR